VGDNPEKDFLGPRALGWTTVMIRREGGVYAHRTPPANGKPEFVLTNLGELPRILRQRDLSS
jgi:FMN phosphatase YigB (HAD superfamily)